MAVQRMAEDKQHSGLVQAGLESEVAQMAGKLQEALEKLQAAETEVQSLRSQAEERLETRLAEREAGKKREWMLERRFEEEERLRRKRGWLWNLVCGNHCDRLHSSNFCYVFCFVARVR